MRTKAIIYKNVIDANSSMSELSRSESEKPTLKKVFRCIDCNFIPILQLKNEESNDPKVQIDCILGHKNELNLNEFMEKSFLNSLGKVKCSECGIVREHKKKYKLCDECEKIFCKECLNEHKSKFENHHFLSIKKMDTICCIHQNKFTNFCKDCNKNICDECIDLHENHQIIKLIEINFTQEKINLIKENLQKEIDNIKEITNIFNEKIENLQDKFENLINIKNNIIKYKSNIVDTYELKDTNYQILTNLNRIKFNNKGYTIDQNLQELETIEQIFKLLDNEKKASKKIIKKIKKGNSLKIRNTSIEKSQFPERANSVEKVEIEKKTKRRLTNKNEVKLKTDNDAEEIQNKIN